MPKRIISSDKIHKGRLPFAQATVAGAFRTETEGTRGFERLQAAFPAGALDGSRIRPGAGRAGGDRVHRRRPVRAARR